MGATRGPLTSALVKIELLSKCCWVLLPTWLGGGSPASAVDAAAATAHGALRNVVGILGTQGCLSWWGLRGWLLKGLGQNLGRGTPEWAALRICIRRQAVPRLPGALWCEGRGNGALELTIPSCLPEGSEIVPMPSRLCCLVGDIMFWLDGGLDGGLALVQLHLEVTCSWMATEGEKRGSFPKLSAVWAAVAGE